MTPPPLLTVIVDRRRLWSNYKVIHDPLNVFHTTRDLLSQILFLLRRNSAGEIHGLVHGLDAYLSQRLKPIVRHKMRLNRCRNLRVKGLVLQRLVAHRRLVAPGQKKDGKNQTKLVYVYLIRFHVSRAHN